MAGKTSEWRPGSTVCRCCLTEGCYKDISTEYFWMGKREVYAEMLSDTLSVSISYAQTGGRLICEPCIARLRDASDFKRQVQDCEKTFMNHLDPSTSKSSVQVEVESLEDVKMERVKVEKDESDDDDDYMPGPDFGDDDDDDDLDDEPLTKLASAKVKVPKKEAVEILDMLDTSQITVKRKSSSKTKEPPKKVKKKEVVVKPTTSKAKQAAAEREKKKKEMKTANAWNHWKQNALIIVKYSTVYPFKLPDSCLVCVYCFERCDNSAMFRQHMEVEHEGMAVPRLIFAHCHESYLKADCTDIKCRICSTQCETLEEISLHLHGVHKKGIDLELPIGIQPFKPDRLECAICGNKSYNLRQLNRHTQSHFLRFTCETCGKAFATKSALTVHAKSVHEITKPYCRKCKTFFDTPSERSKHLVTSSKCWTYICRRCGERFSTWELKQVHLEKVHGEAQNTICPQCGIEFGTRKILKTHFRLQHTDDNYVCTVCGLKFASKKAIEEHRVTHTKERNFHCTSCNKSFARKKNLIQHMWIHSEYKRFECKMCDKKFNQRVSWKSHMKTNHPALYMETGGDYKFNQTLIDN